MDKPQRTVEELLEAYPGATLVRDWNDLRNKVSQESENYILEVNEYNAYVNRKTPIDKTKQGYRLGEHRMYYLSTHTFYDKVYESSTELLQACGFNVVIDNWDKPYMTK